MNKTSNNAALALVESTAPAVPSRILVTSGDEGNFGKSTLIRHLIRPALAPYFSAGVRFLAIEEEGRLSTGEDAKFKSTEVTAIISEMEMLDADEALIIEIGAQRFERFTTELSRVKAGRFTFDKVVVPLGQSFKAEETFKSLVKIIGQGIDPRRMYVVFNNIELLAISEGTFKASLKTHYKSFIDAVHELGINVCPTPVMKSDIFGALRKKVGNENTIMALASLPADHFTQLAKVARRAGDDAAKNEFLSMSSIQMQACAMVEDFKQIFSFIFPELM